MNKKEIAFLSFKLIAIYAFIYAVGSFQTIGVFLFNLIGPRGDPNFILRLVVMIFVPFMLGLVAWFLWSSAERMAGKLFGTENAPASGGRSASEFQLVAFRVLGVYLLVRAIPQLARVLLYVFVRAQNEALQWRMTAERNGEILSLILEIGAAVWLLYGAPGLKRMSEQVRGAGTEANE